MHVFGTDAFHPDMSPDSLFRISAGVLSSDEQLSEELAAFAADFAAIRNLPEPKDAGFAGAGRA